AFDDAKRWLTTFHVAPMTFGMGGRDSRSSKKISVNNREWSEDRMETPQEGQGFVRWHQEGQTLHMVGYRNKRQALPKEIVDKFVESHEILGGDPAELNSPQLSGWETYTSPDGAFKAAFPGPTSQKAASIPSAASSEFREYTVMDEKKGKGKSYIAGYVRFAKKPQYKDLKEVR